MIGDSDDDGGNDVYKGRAEPVLVSLLDSYSNNDTISVGDSKYSSYSTYTIY